MAKGKILGKQKGEDGEEEGRDIENSRDNSCEEGKNQMAWDRDTKRERGGQHQ